MSHHIVKHRFVLTIPDPAPERPESSITHQVLYLSFGEDNNIQPRHFDGEVSHVDSIISWVRDTTPFTSRITVPAKLWQEGYHADVGNITVFPDRSISGISYIRGWMDAAARPIPAIDSDGRVLIHFSLTIWMDQQWAAKFRAMENPGFESHEKDRLAAWNRLIVPLLEKFDRPCTYGNRESIPLPTHEDLHAAALLCRWQPHARKSNDGCFSIHITTHDWYADQLLSHQKEIPAKPAKPSPPSFKPGDIVELYGKRYRLIDRIKSSWKASRIPDGKIYKIGPKHLTAATMSTPEANVTPQPLKVEGTPATTPVAGTSSPSPSQGQPVPDLTTALDLFAA